MEVEKVDWRKIELEWDSQKSREVKLRRGVSLEEIVALIRRGKVLAFIKHHNQRKYPNQYFIVVDVEGYPWAVASEFRGNKLRLITAFPARKFKRLTGK
jgi:uncharacterized DUF497 family protein